MNLIKSVFRAIYRILITIKNLLILPFDRSLTCATSYFPELANSRKSRLTILIEQTRHIIKYSAPNKFYFLYGLDIKGRENSYVDYTLFMLQRNKNNNATAANSSVGILRNKFYFGIIADSLGISSPNNIGIINNNEIFDLKSKETIPLAQFICNATEKFNVFIKSIDGECGNGVYHAIIENGVATIEDKTYDPDSFIKLFQSGGRYLVQQCITQHHEISRIYSKSINTIRLETVYNHKTGLLEILPPLLRVGRGNNSVDNWAMGGLAIGINIETETLAKYGFYKPTFGTKTTCHPDSGVVFSDYKIPYLKESIELAKKFHSYFPDIHSIGWDIAITENGPCIIEGNDNWEISLVQICSHGLRKEFDSLFR